MPGTHGGLFVLVQTSSAAWTVRRSRDGGTSWLQVDNYKPGLSTVATSIISDLRGRIYVAGYTVGEPWRWEVRQSDNGGTSWKTISPKTATAQYNGVAGGIAIDPSGNLFIAGSLDAWAVARRTPEGVWQEPEFPLGSDFPSQANAITVDAVGNVFVAGRVWSSKSGTRAEGLLVQRLAATTLPPLEASQTGGGLALSWPAAVGSAVLESCDAIGLQDAVWVPVTTPPVIVENRAIVTLEAAVTRFFRLRKP